MNTDVSSITIGEDSQEFDLDLRVYVTTAAKSGLSAVGTESCDTCTCTCGTCDTCTCGDACGEG
jgi:hypothetical protein